MYNEMQDLSVLLKHKQTIVLKNISINAKKLQIGAENFAQTKKR